MITPNHTANGDLRVDRLGASSMKDVIYKTVGGKALYASIVVPHDLRSGSYPVVIRWHGGGLVNGHRLYAPWFARYLLDYIQKAKAIIVLPDYRLLPGASGMDILEDVRDFFTWLDQGNLGPHLDDGVFANLDDMMVSGESAGGWLAIQSALTQCPGRFRALIAQYPMVDMRDSHWTMPDSKKYLGGSIATDLKDLDKFWKPEEKIVTSRMPPDGGEIYHCLVRQGLYGKVFGHDKELYPLELLDEVSTTPSRCLRPSNGL